MTTRTHAANHPRQALRWSGVAAIVALSAAALTGCSGAAADPALDWTPSASCPNAAAVGATSGLSPLRFTVAMPHAESLQTTGCSYRDPADSIRLDVDVVPGPPSQVEFGSAVKLRDTELPKLGSGAHVGISPVYCGAAVPKVHSGTIQLNIIDAGKASKTESHACAMVLPVLKEFAHQH